MFEEEIWMHILLLLETIYLEYAQHVLFYYIFFSSVKKNRMSEPSNNVTATATKIYKLAVLCRMRSNTYISKMNEENFNTRYKNNTSPSKCENERKSKEC